MSMDQVINLLAAITLIEMMMTIGLCARVSQVIDVVTDWRMLARAALANYVVVPAIAVGLLWLFGAKPLVAAGFLIAAVCPGAPFGPPFTALARGSVGVAVGLMVVLAGSSALIAPFLLQVLMPLTSGTGSVDIRAAKLVGVLLMAQLLPLCVGLAIRQAYPVLAERLKTPFSRASTLLNLATFGLIITEQFATLVEIRPAAYGGMLALVGGSVAAGWLLGGSGTPTRTAMAMATSVRNVGVAMVIATGSFAGTAAVTAATAFAVLQTLAMAVIALLWGRLVSVAAESPIQAVS